MAYTAKQLITAISFIYLAILTAVAGYAFYKTRAHALPIPTVLSAFTLALPPVAGLSLSSAAATSVQKGTKPQARLGLTQPKLAAYLLSFFLLTIYETVIASLSATYVGPPSSLKCGLNERWQALFHNKDEKIKIIQEAFDCCGLHSVVDRAFPFPAKGVGVNACHLRYQRNKSCFGDWRQEEQRMAGLMLTVALLVALWKILVTILPFTRRPSWLNGLLSRLGSEDGENGTPAGRVANGYSGNPIIDEVSGSEAGEPAQRAITEGPLIDVDGDQTILTPHVQPSALNDDRDAWRSP